MSRVSSNSIRQASFDFSFHERERLRVFCEHGGEHAGDNVTKSSDTSISGLRLPSIVSRFARLPDPGCLEFHRRRVTISSPTH